VRLKIPPQFQGSSLVTKIAYTGYSQFMKNDSFSFYLSMAVLLVFLYLIAAYASARQCVIIIYRCPQTITEISLSRKNVHRNML
jgi:multidrug efflux pump subunit AcrB